MKTVISSDGTSIAYETVGEGPALLLVEGASATRSASVTLANLLAPDFTVYYYDRRGRGDSTDTQPYAVQREIEDIEALVDAAGGKAYLYGISSGGALALEAAFTLKEKIEKLAVYEIPYDESEAGMKAWKKYRVGLENELKAENRGGAASVFLKFVGVPDDMIRGMKTQPFWADMEEIAPTLLYDAACLGDDRVVPIERARILTAPTLIIDGEASQKYMPFMHISAEALAHALPHATRKTLDGQTHDVDMTVLAPILKDFYQSAYY